MLLPLSMYCRQEDTSRFPFNGRFRSPFLLLTKGRLLLLRREYSNSLPLDVNSYADNEQLGPLLPPDCLMNRVSIIIFPFFREGSTTASLQDVFFLFLLARFLPLTVKKISVGSYSVLAFAVLYSLILLRPLPPRQKAPAFIPRLLMTVLKTFLFYLVVFFLWTGYIFTRV